MSEKNIRPESKEAIAPQQSGTINNIIFEKETTLREAPVSDDMITAVLAGHYGIPFVNLELFIIDEHVLQLIPPEVAQKYSVLPLALVGDSLTLGMVDPTNVFAVDDIKFITGLNVEPALVGEVSIQQAFAKYYQTPREDNEEIDLATLSRISDDAPVVRLVNVLLVDALRRDASDIHIEPYEQELRIRFRINGVLYDVMHPPLTMRDALISRIKIMSKLDISEKRLPQDGRIKLKVELDSRERDLDFRVSTQPTLFGEKVVLRLLDEESLMLDIPSARELEQLNAKTAELLKESELAYERITKDQEETERLKMETREMLARLCAA